MTSFLLDTNIVSELARPRPSSKVVAFMRQTPLTSLYLSDAIIAEIRFGIEKTPDPVERERLASWLRNLIRPQFQGRILPVTEDIFLRWRVLLEAGRRRGYTFAEPDLMIAATASYHGLTVATRDVEPFREAGVPFLDPWRGNP